jgi:Spy/CpxP family protein refolding chaperone
MKAKSKFSAFLIATTLLVVFSIKGQVQAQNTAARAEEMKSNEYNMQKEHFGMIAGLTEEQKTKLKDLMYERAKERQMTKAELAEKRAHLRILSLADAPDRKAIDKTIDEISALQGTMMKHAIDMKFNLKGVLTPEQYKVWEMHRHQAKFMNHSGGRYEAMRKPGNKMHTRGQKQYNNMDKHPSEAPGPDQNN